MSYDENSTYPSYSPSSQFSESMEEVTLDHSTTEAGTFQHPGQQAVMASDIEEASDGSTTEMKAVPSTPMESTMESESASSTPVEPVIGPQPSQETKKRKRMSTPAIIVLVVVLVVVFGGGIFSGWVFSKVGNTSSISGSPITSNAPVTGNAAVVTQEEQAIAKINPAVVQINVTTAQGQDAGSGVIIDSKGDIITNNHVVNGEVSMGVVLSNGVTENAQLVATSPNNDLAIVRIQPVPNMTVATIGNSSTLTVGQQVFAIGNPLGNGQTVTHGIISALNRSVTEPSLTSSTANGPTLTNVIQTDAPINPGNSGGALVNLQGQLIGIPTLTSVDQETNTPANGVGFAISSNQVKTVIAQLLKQNN
jgi:S1-C subfamily serine protease